MEYIDYLYRQSAKSIYTAYKILYISTLGYNIQSMYWRAMSFANTMLLANMYNLYSIAGCLLTTCAQCQFGMCDR